MLLLARRLNKLHVSTYNHDVHMRQSVYRNLSDVSVTDIIRWHKSCEPTPIKSAVNCAVVSLIRDTRRASR